MANPSKIDDRRRQFTPLVAAAFIELGYRGTTTAELAQRCGVRENVLYRIWPTKKAMFLDAVEHVFTATMSAWDGVTRDKSLGKTVAERILRNQADYQGRLRLYRIVFAGMTEEDPEIKNALRDVYRRLHRFISQQIEQHRGRYRRRGGPPAELTAWAMIGLASVVDMQRELEILPVADRKRIMKEVGMALLDGTTA
jgi:AcrR family transcriptional regulator